MEIDNIKTIAAAWDSFSSECMPKEVCEIQRQETRRAFYAGAVISVALAAMAMQDGPGSLFTKIDSLINECDEYSDLVKMGVG